jgi:hypothetical protein
MFYVALLPTYALVLYFHDDVFLCFPYSCLQFSNNDHELSYVEVLRNLFPTQIE